MEEGPSWVVRGWEDELAPGVEEGESEREGRWEMDGEERWRPRMPDMAWR